MLPRRLTILLVELYFFLVFASTHTTYFSTSTEQRTARWLECVAFVIRVRRLASGCPVRTQSHVYAENPGPAAKRSDRPQPLRPFVPPTRRCRRPPRGGS